MEPSFLSKWSHGQAVSRWRKGAHRVLVPSRLIGPQEFRHERHHRPLAGSLAFYPDTPAFVPSQRHNVDFPHLGIPVTAIGEGELLCGESPECRGAIRFPRDCDVLLPVQFRDNAPVSRDEFVEGLATIRTAPFEHVHESGKGNLTFPSWWREGNPGPIRHRVSEPPI